MNFLNNTNKSFILTFLAFLFKIIFLEYTLISYFPYTRSINFLLSILPQEKCNIDVICILCTVELPSYDAVFAHFNCM